MPIKLKDLKDLHDKAYQANSVTRDRAAEDMVFYHITHWDDQLLADSQLAYRGEFDILRKAGRKILGDLNENPVQVDFTPKDETRDDAAEVADGLYRSDDNNNLSIEAYELAKQESVVCGFGAWELYTEYITMRSANDKQVVRRRPLYEANNNCYWDPNAKLLDKSDAKYVSYLDAYSEDGYKDLVHEMTGEEIDEINPDSFKEPEHSYMFPWVGGEDKKIYVVTFYHMEKVKDKILFMKDPFEFEMELKESSLKDVMDDMLESGFEIVDEKPIERWEVRKYIASGEEILNGDMVDDERTGEVIAGENIPIVPVYGEHAFVEGEEHWEGVTRLTKDPQRLRDFGMSYLADIVSRSPRTKPIFFPEQVQGWEDMYSLSGAENNFPYVYQNRKTADGEQLPIGPVGILPEQPVPTSLIGMLDATRQAVEDVANPGTPQDVADPDMSGKAIYAIQASIDIQSAVYQTHFKHAKRRDAEIWVGMASEIYDTQRDVLLTQPDGTTVKGKVMNTALDKETGDLVILNDLKNAIFDVHSKIGPSYTSQREQTVERLNMMANGLDPADPMRKALHLKMLALMDGVEFDDIRDHANKELVLSGIKKPETPEEEQMLAQAQAQPQEPTAEMVLAQGEMMKGKAALEKNQIEAAKVQTNAQNEQVKRLIDRFEAVTDRMDTQIDAQKAGAEIDYKRSDKLGKDLDNVQKIKELEAFDYASATTEDLFKELAA